MKNILITLPLSENEKDLFQDKVKDSSDEIRLSFIDETAVSEKDITSADAIIGMVSPSLLKNVTSLEWMQLAWAGADRYTLPGVLPSDTILTSASGAYGISVAEHMLSLTFALYSGLNIYSEQQKNHEWKLNRGKKFIYGSNVLVLGIGDIGGCYAEKMKALGAHVTGVCRTPKEKADFLDEQYTIDALDSIIGSADIVALALPAGESTYHVIGREQLLKMKSDSVIINAGRGSTIDTSALTDALKNGTIGGAGLDVLENEPLSPDSELWDMKNVIITPHAAGKLEDEFNKKRVIALCADNLYRYVHKEKLLHIVDRNTGY